MGSSSEATKGFETRAIHAGQSPDPSTGAIMTPVYLTSTFVQEAPGVTKDGYDYARSANPTRRALEANLASLESGRHGFCFASGCAAMDAVLHLLSTGDHVILCNDVYGGTFRIFDKVFKRHGVSYTSVDLTNLTAVREAVTLATKLIWAETPTNPVLRVVDIAGVASIAKERKLLLAVDNTFASPYLQNPLTLGADIVVHSTTKYLGGHSDLIGGAVVVNDDELASRISFVQNAVGAVQSPFDAFLVLRSTKTLALRMERHCKNAHEIAVMASESPKVRRVFYPGLPTHPDYAVQARQMRYPGAMVSIDVAGGKEGAVRFLQALKIFSLAESLGGVESLAGHPATMTHASIPVALREAVGITDSLVRLSVGVESIEDLKEDLAQALSIL